MLNRMEDAFPLSRIRTVILQEEFTALQKEVRTVHVDETIKQYIVGLTTATRQHPDVTLGASPRASIALMRASQARAFLQAEGMSFRTMSRS